MGWATKLMTWFHTLVSYGFESVKLARDIHLLMEVLIGKSLLLADQLVQQVTLAQLVLRVLKVKQVYKAREALLALPE
jgi:hypothetical protein